ncbi:MAG: DUF4491 family protein [Bacteroidales bacterium]|nr:DUF4491 family protein [Bacteroidales bacterium]
MYFTGIIIGLATFLIIGLFHPIVIKAEYYLGTKCWWAFLLAGMVFCAVVLLYTCLFQASGKAPQALMMSLSRQGVLFMAVFLIATAAAGYQGFLAAQLIADVLSAVLALLLYRRMYCHDGLPTR